MENRKRSVEDLGMMRILHIAAHLGGGVGKAISGIAIQSRHFFGDTHRILLLQQPEKAGYVQACQKSGVEVDVWDGGQALLRWADVVVVSWWNHPVMARFLRDWPQISRPLVLWCHVNGCHYPMLPAAFAEEFDRILFTSTYSLDNPLWTRAERRRIREKSEVVWGMGQFTPAEMGPKSDYQNHDAFTVGYVGTLNYGKIHPDFAAYCKEACGRVPKARFVLAGDRDGALEQELRSAGLADRVTFAGFVSDVPALMRTFDVFGYLLNPEHYGTTENVLLEAMACGLPVVALRQNVEQYIVPPEAGVLVENASQYAWQLEALWKDPARREKMGRCARAYVIERYDGRMNAESFRNACHSAASDPGRAHRFAFLGDSPWEWFLYFLDERNRERFEAARRTGGSFARDALRSCPPILKEERKSSLRHFAAIYPQDESLRMFRGLLEE